MNFLLLDGFFVCCMTTLSLGYLYVAFWNFEKIQKTEFLSLTVMYILVLIFYTITFLLNPGISTFEVEKFEEGYDEETAK